MIRRFDAPLTTHVDYRVRPGEWLVAAVLSAALMVIGVTLMGWGPL